jgi:hypothetical protein
MHAAIAPQIAGSQRMAEDLTPARLQCLQWLQANVVASRRDALSSQQLQQLAVHVGNDEVRCSSSGGRRDSGVRAELAAVVPIVGVVCALCWSRCWRTRRWWRRR